MSNKSGWALGGLVVLVALVFGMSQLAAQRPPGAAGEGRPGAVGPGEGVIGGGGGIGGGGALGGGIGFGGFEMPGRFVVARVVKDDVILLDTATGKLYKASDKDVRPYKDLPKIGGATMPLFPPKDKEPFPGDKKPKPKDD